MARVPLVTVSIPAWRCADTIHATVSSVLAQTVTDIQVIVTNDGDDPALLDCLGDITDSRLIVRRSERNVGRYAIDHGIAQSCRSQWMAICDADDYVDPTWLESMLASANDADVVVAPHYVHDLTGRSGIYSVRSYTGTFGWQAHMGACLWSAQWLRDVGATTPHVRVGWDNIMVGLAFMRGRVAVIEQATYHRVRRSDSLTTARSTGMRSPHRTETTRLLRDIWQDLLEDPLRSHDVTTSLDYDRRLMLHPYALPTTDWSMTSAALAELESYLYRESPRQIVEMGSGLSTIVLAHYARITGASVTTLEHDARYLRQTEQMLRERGLDHSVTLAAANLIGSPPTYKYDLPDEIDFLVIDGPPERHGGRAGTLTHAMPHFAKRWTAWLDDGDRPGEIAAVQQWRSDHGIYARQTQIPRGVTLVSSRQMRRHKIDATGVVICVLTGWRSHLLDRTLSSLPSGLLSTAHVIVCHDGGDDETRRVLERYESDIDILHTKTHTDRQMDTIGENWSALAAEAVNHGAYMMMLEDDWQYITEDPTWLQHSIDALADPNIYQVRLRHISDPVRARHMVTAEQTLWTPHRDGLIADGHLTFNPSLMRTSDLHRVFPAEGERDAQHHAYDEDMRCTVQLVPGVFHHIGAASDSMRAVLQPPT